MSFEIRPLTDDDREQAWSLGRLAFGGDPAALPPADFRADDGLALVDAAGRLLGKCRLRSYEQWWGGRRVPMGGVAGVAVHQDARGTGAASRLVRAMLPMMQERGHAVSVLYPTAVGLYRPLGWEIVGSLDETTLATADLRAAGDPVGVRVRTAGPADAAAVHELYSWYGETCGGLLTRTGPEFPAGPSGLLGHDVVALAEAEDGALLGYASYDRGRGYGPQARLRVWELVTRSGEAGSALVRSLGSWDSVAPTVEWRGPTDELSLLLSRPVPGSHAVQPWMLRIVDAAAAIAQRGFAPAASVDASFALVDPDLVGHDGAWRLVVRDGVGTLERDTRAGDLPLLHVRGLALLYAGAADTGLLLRAGLLDRPMPTLDAAFAGPRPRLLDYF